MSTSFFRLTVLAVCWLMLGGFRMAPPEATEQAHLLYDVRGAFVSAQATVSRRLLADTDRLVNDAIRATFRQTSMPRTVLTVRITESGSFPLLIGARYRAKVQVEATAVGNGESVAIGTFTVSAFAFDAGDGDALVASKIAARIAREFNLEERTPSTLATALFP
ncbi:hypothetical protein J2858_002392 [Neorhizobium galegae]|uniref:hypothetical protein n=1 Tax=Neorhizobium galegae TaxID=399 RepID=UPI001AE4D87B|nr:hypothetical protein [Neorhizobium galegae]MBP2549469.1 hypothetical protein [Neorhizobium galegae]